jgi:hypothetical protein
MLGDVMRFGALRPRLTYPATERGLNGGGGPTWMTRAIWRDTREEYDQ